jgi:TolB-like protein
MSQEIIMSRSMSRAARWIAAAAMAVPAFAHAQADNRPVVVVFTFTNSSIGPAKGDFDGIATGIQDLLITDLASSNKIRLVDRSRISEILQEQNMVRNGQIDAQTAVKLGKILGAQYAITGGFMADKAGNAVMTGRTIDIETTQIANPQKITGKSDDFLAMIAQLSSKFGADMSLAPKPGRASGDAGSKSGPAQSGSSSGSSTSSSAKSTQVETYAKPLPTNVVDKTMKTKLDAATMKLYSKALDEIDAKNKEKAADLLRQVKAKAPDFEPAQRNLDKLLAKAGA